MKDPYKTLRVKRDASPDDIRSAYRKLIAKNHPDRNIGDTKATERFKEIQAAYDLLSDPERRKRFDETGDTSNIGTDQAVQLLTTIFTQLLNGLTGQGVDLRFLDLCQEIEKTLLNGRTRLGGELKRLRSIEVDLNIVIDRLAVADGENVLQEVAKHNLQLTTSSIEQGERELGKIVAALAHLKKFSYRVDSPFGGIVSDVWRILHQPEPKKPSEY